MIDIHLIENYLLPSIYGFFTIAVFLVFFLILNRFRQLSNYQRRILKIVHPKILEEKLNLTNYLKHFSYQLVENLNKILKKLGVIGGIKTKKLSQQLTNAGFRTKQAYTLFLLARILLISIAILVALKIYNQLTDSWHSINYLIILLLSAALIGNLLPTLYLKNAIRSYRNNIKKALPDALELMVLCFEAGYSNEKALDKIAKDFADYFPALSQEFLITASELRILPDRKMAWKNFAERTELAEINGIVIALQHNEKYGTPLSIAIKNQIEILRKSRLLKVEQKAARIPVLLSIPLITCFVPVLFAIILAPAVIKISQIIDF